MQNTMLNDTDNLRFERKFAIHGEDTKNLVTIIKLNSALFNEVYSERIVNSMYFDTNSFQFYSDNLSGNSKRSKVRVRWYGDQIDKMTDAKLEIKSKNGNVGDKATFDLGNFKTLDFYNNYLEFFSNSDKIDKEYQALLKNLFPAIIVSYSRRYFLSSDKTFRITLDYDLNFYDIRTNFSNGKNISSDTSVIELKYKFKEDEKAELITNQFRYRYSKCSKYVIGLESIFN